MQFDDDMTAGEIVGLVYSQFEPRAVWDADRLAGMNTDEPARLYCPSCNKLGIFKKSETYAVTVNNGGKDITVNHPWYCPSCKTYHAHPRSLTRRGGMGGSETRSSKRDNDWAIVDGIMAGKVMHAVDSLPVPARSWTLWVYTDDAQAGYQSALLDHIIAQLDSAETKARTLREGYTIVRLILLLTDNARERQRNGRELRSLNYIADSLRIPASEIKGDKRDRKWARIRKDIDHVLTLLEGEMDSAVMAVVESRMVNGNRADGRSLVKS